jgi:hypothetical protein
MSDPDPGIVLRPAFGSYVRASFGLTVVAAAVLVVDLLGHAFTRLPVLALWVVLTLCFVGIPLAGSLRSRLFADAARVGISNWRDVEREYPRRDIRAIQVQRSAVAFVGRAGAPVFRMSRGMWQDEQLLELSRYLRIPIRGRRRDTGAEF